MLFLVLHLQLSMFQTMLPLLGLLMHAGHFISLGLKGTLQVNDSPFLVRLVRQLKAIEEALRIGDI